MAFSMSSAATTQQPPNIRPQPLPKPTTRHRSMDQAGALAGSHDAHGHRHGWNVYLHRRRISLRSKDNLPDLRHHQLLATTTSQRIPGSAFVPLPAPRGAGGMELLDGYLHFFDGLSPVGKTPESNHWMLDLSSSNPQWVAAAPTPFSPQPFLSAVLDGKIYLMGGPFPRR